MLITHSLAAFASCELAPNHYSKPQVLGSLPFERVQQEMVTVQLHRVVSSVKRSTWIGLLVDAAVATSCIACPTALVVWIAG